MSGVLVLMAFGALLAQAPDSDLAAVARWLPGTYDTFAQAAADEAQRTTYRHVKAVLRVVPVSIDGLPADARAFYLEQALAGQDSAPYRQRVIVLRRQGGALINELHRLQNPAAYVGFNGGRAMAAPELLREAGCDASWQRVSSTSFKGSAGTDGTCASTLRGATHAVSMFELTSDVFLTLDQGLDDAGVVRWGPPAEAGAHRFVKR